jgi:hypothetical protein
MGFIALKPMNIDSREVAPGDLLPDAASWPNLASIARTGFLAYVTDGQEQLFLERLCRGELPQELAPGVDMAHLVHAARRLQGTVPALLLKTPSAPPRKRKDA